MNMDNRLKFCARQDLHRFFQGRDLTDAQLAGPLLSAPGMSLRERDAATALDALASYEAMRKRTVEETTSSIGMDEDAPDDGLTFEQVRHLWARREVYRRAAFVYARMIGDEQLIEHYQTPEPEPSEAAEPMDDSNAPETTEQRQDRRLQSCIDAGLPMDAKAALSRLPDGVGIVADREGVTRQAFSADVKAALKRRESTRREGVTVHRA